MSYHLLNRAAEPGIEEAAAAGLGILVRDGLGAGRLTPRVLGSLAGDSDLAGQIEPLLELLGAGRDGVEAAAAELPALSLAFLHRNPAVSSVLVGTKSPGHLREDVAAAAEQVDAALIDEAVRLS